MFDVFEEMHFVAVRDGRVRGEPFDAKARSAQQQQQQLEAELAKSAHIEPENTANTSVPAGHSVPAIARSTLR